MAQSAFGIGLVLGKFLPPHAGHLHLIRFARERCQRVIVLACSLKREPIAGELRAAWLREIFAGDLGVQIIHVTDENPQYPHEHPEFWPIWRETVRRACPTYPEALFTSEDYGEEFARVLGINHVLCDRERTRFPISGTQARKQPLKHWDFLPPPVRAHYAKRVVITGPESTGKTTLAQKLAAHFRTVWVPEFARGYLDEANAREKRSHFFQPQDVEPIARGQIANEDRLARECNRVLICDSDLLVTHVYSEHYFGACPHWLKVEAAQRQYALYLFCDTDVPWVSDAQRDQGSEAQRARMRELFLKAVKGRNVVMVRGAWEQRFRTAVSAIEQIM